ncbi:hypothetical protein JZ751_000653 [Albula glossodonta]|uniref:G-protein coupled receptors family 1 profile domain-containing protein n=1 Tax=Albula glossodonta TaxID=121402 RepID=A0A8T2PWZ4_9TELE|nr:hypothetical protein JZ751_000653 [Albula glossodonta]
MATVKTFQLLNSKNMSELDNFVSSTQVPGYDYDYSHYYSYGDYPHYDYGLCEKKHVRAFAKTFLPVFYGFVCALTIVGNALLVFVLIRYIKLRSLTSVLLLNKSVADIFFAVTLPFWAVYIHSGWIFGDTGCKVITVIYTVSFYSSIFFITCISLDRYLNIVWTNVTKTFGTLQRRCMICVVVWAISFLATAPELNFVKMQDFYGEMSCTHDFGDEHMSPWKIYLKFQINILGFLIPFLAMVFFYLRICCVVVKSGIVNKSRALKLAVALVLIYFVLWFPYNLVLFLHSLQDLQVISNCATSQQLDLALQITESLAFTHAFMNPILYAFVNKKFSGFLSKILEKIKKTGKSYSLEWSGSTSSGTGQNNEVELTVIENVQ